MTATELALMCHEAMEAGGRYIYIDQKGKWGKTDHRYLAGKGSPMGTIVTDTIGPGRLMVRYDADEVMRFIAPLAQEEIDSGRVVLKVQPNDPA